MSKTCHHLRRRDRGHMMYVCNFNRQLTCMWRRSLQVIALFPVICDERLRRVGTARLFFKARFRTHTSLCEAWVCESLLVIDLVLTRPTSLSLSLSLSLSTTREPAIRRAPGRRELAPVREERVWFVLSFGGPRGYDTQRVRVFPARRGQMLARVTFPFSSHAQGPIFSTDTPQMSAGRP